MSINLLLVDDHAIVRAGYRSLLQQQPDLVVIAEAVNATEAYACFKSHQPDVVIMDITLLGQSGLEAITHIRQHTPTAKILVFSMHQHPSFALHASRAGALGYVTKSSPPAELIRAIYEVYAGRHSLSTDIAQALALEKLKGDNLALEQLTVREFEILRLLVDANSTEDIAKILNISPKTVSNCHYLIKRKLGVSNDIQLTHLAIRMNVVNLLEIPTLAQDNTAHN